MNDREDQEPGINDSKDYLTAGPCARQPKTAPRPQTFEAPKPLTPKQKVKAITPASETTLSKIGGPVSKGLLCLQLQNAGGCLPIAHCARQAPAQQSLELHHGGSFPLQTLNYSSQTRFYDEPLRMLITDLIRIKMWIVPLPSS